MEWKLQRTARRRIRTEEEMLWVSTTILFFLDPTLTESMMKLLVGMEGPGDD